jgi:peptide deformylase
VARQTITRLGEPILRQRAVELEASALSTSRIRHLVDDMVDTMRAVGGVGLAAPQIGESLRLVVVEVRDNERYPEFPKFPLRVLANPVVTPESAGSPVRPEDSISIYEGCLSIPGIRARVTRPRRVRVQALRADGATLDEFWEGAAAAIIQHEVDHLDGKLIVDRADLETLCFEEEYRKHVPDAARVVDGHAPTKPRSL